jgi:hypothetical protein
LSDTRRQSAGNPRVAGTSRFMAERYSGIKAPVLGVSPAAMPTGLSVAVELLVDGEPASLAACA